MSTWIELFCLRITFIRICDKTSILCPSLTRWETTKVRKCCENTKPIHYPYSKFKKKKKKPWNKEQNKREIKIKDKDMVFSKHSLMLFYVDASSCQ